MLPLAYDEYNHPRIDLNRTRPMSARLADYLQMSALPQFEHDLAEKEWGYLV